MRRSAATSRPVATPASAGRRAGAAQSRRERGPARILVVGGGGREHALVWSLARDAGVEAVVATPGSDAIAVENKVHCVPGISADDPAAIVNVATSERVDLVVIGPESPLAAGVADALIGARMPVFGPSREAARIEWSKAFCREVAACAGVRMARGRPLRRLEPALAFARELASAPAARGVVVKANGLAAGRGVTVCDDFAEAEAALRHLFEAVPAGTEPEQPVAVVEERLFGAEASLIAICDDHAALAMPAARDHKRLLDGDAGPNTGGMGAYSPVPDLPESLSATLVDVIHLPILAELARRGAPFRGALYAGLILTPEGPVLLECNARFGDPETQALLPRLAVPLGPLLAGAARGDLEGAAAGLGLTGRTLPTTGDASVAIVMASHGYPGKPRRGDAISGLEEASRAGALVFHANTARGPGGDYRTDGGRVLSVVGLGATLAVARAHAERAAAMVSWEGVQRRHDIAARLPAGVQDRTGTSPEPISASHWGGGNASSGRTPGSEPPGVP